MYDHNLQLKNTSGVFVSTKETKKKNRTFYYKPISNYGRCNIKERKKKYVLNSVTMKE